MPDRNALAPAALAMAARGLLPMGVAVAASDPRRPAPPLWPGESPGGAAEGRLREYAHGRTNARAAMAELGIISVAIPMLPDRAPDWPAGIAGSITHCATVCVAAIARTNPLRGIGLDVEPDAPLAADLWEPILLAQERDWLATQPQPDRGHLALLIFSAKEAAYKAQYPLSKTLFGFETLHIALTPQDQSFTAEFRHAVPYFAKGTCLHGRYSRAENHLITAVTI